MLKLHKKTLAALLKIVRKDAGRYAMDSAMLEMADDGKSGKLIATDGRRLILIPVEVMDKEELPHGYAEHEETSGLVSREVLEAACKGPKGKTPFAFLECNGSAIIREPWERKPDCPAPGGSKIEMRRGEDAGEFPRYEAVIPEATNVENSFCVNAKYLSEVAAALAAAGGEHDAVRIYMPASKCSPVRMESVGNGPHAGAVGVIMPITIDQ